ncbi:MAG: ribonuclease III [Lachnospiraceae bacterium]|nr:ribonuclease III [Lachnospiraceae bacterium]
MNNKYPLGRLEKNIGYKFKDRELLLTALTHSSLKNEVEDESRDDYERQEYLGDAVLELVSSEFIYHKYPEMREGEMTKLRASLVCEPSLTQCAKDIDLPDFIMLGKGEDRQDSRHKDSIVSDVFEALIGGIYLDAGLTEAKKFIERFVLDDMENRALFHDSKTQLQNIAQAEGWELEYELVGESGPEHMKRFTMAVKINGEEISRKTGSSKKGAAQEAAYDALVRMRKI